MPSIEITLYCIASRFWPKWLGRSVIIGSQFLLHPVWGAGYNIWSQILDEVLALQRNALELLLQLDPDRAVSLGGISDYFTMPLSANHGWLLWVLIFPCLDTHSNIKRDIDSPRVFTAQHAERKTAGEHSSWEHCSSYMGFSVWKLTWRYFREDGWGDRIWYNHWGGGWILNSEWSKYIYVSLWFWQSWN